MKTTDQGTGRIEPMVMFRPASEIAKLLHEEWRKNHVGGCKQISLGNDCLCHLCLIDSLQYIAELNRKARQAFRFYVLASDAELAEAKMTREDALSAAYGYDEAAREAEGIKAGNSETSYYLNGLVLKLLRKI